MFHWICPECGSEIPPTVRVCGRCEGPAEPQVNDSVNLDGAINPTEVLAAAPSAASWGTKASWGTSPAHRVHHAPISVQKMPAPVRQLLATMALPPAPPPSPDPEPPVQHLLPMASLSGSIGALAARLNEDDVLTPVFSMAGKPEMEDLLPSLAPQNFLRPLDLVIAPEPVFLPEPEQARPIQTEPPASHAALPEFFSRKPVFDDDAILPMFGAQPVRQPEAARIPAPLSAAPVAIAMPAPSTAPALAVSAPVPETLPALAPRVAQLTILSVDPPLAGLELLPSPTAVLPPTAALTTVSEPESAAPRLARLSAERAGLTPELPKGVIPEPAGMAPIDLFIPAAEPAALALRSAENVVVLPAARLRTLDASSCAIAFQPAMLEEQLPAPGVFTPTPAAPRWSAAAPSHALFPQSAALPRQPKNVAVRVRWAGSRNDSQGFIAAIQPMNSWGHVLRPENTPRLTLPGPVLPSQLRSLAHAGLSILPGYQLGAKGSQQPTNWLLTIAITLVFMVLGIGTVSYMTSNSAANAEPAPVAPDATPATAIVATAAPTTGSSPLSKMVEVTGFRLVNSADKKPEIHYLVVNHSGASLTGLTIYVTLRVPDARPGQPPFSRFSFRAPVLGPYESREMISPIERMPRELTLPQWQELKAEIEIAR